MDDTRLPDGPWLDRLNPAFLRSAFPSWAARAADLATAAECFRDHAIACLAPLDDNLQFDPDYFRETDPGWEEVDDQNCYRGWLMEGIARGQYASGAEHLRALRLPLVDYPAAFAWQYYGRLRPSAGGHRWAALDDFCTRGFAEFGDGFAFGPTAASFLCALGRRFSGTNDELAIHAYERARSLGALPAEERQHLADAYLRRHLWRPALQVYSELIRGDSSTGWTVRNLAKCAVAVEAWPDLFASLDRARERHSSDTLWPDSVKEATHGLFRARAKSAGALMASGAHAEADGLLAKTVADLAPVIEYLTPDDASVGPSGIRRVLLIANLDDPESAQRCVHDKTRLLDALGVPWDLFSFNGAAELAATLPNYDALILFRVPALPDIIQIILGARRIGIPSFYDSDGQLSGPDSTPALASFRGKISDELYDGLRTAITLQLAAARLCDFGIAPTESLATAMRPLVREQRCFVVPDASLPTARLASARAAKGHRPLRLFLRSASLMFVDAVPGTVGHALLTLLQRRSDVVLHISGQVQLDAQFDDHGHRIHRVPDSGELFGYWAELSKADINLVPWCDTAGQEYRAGASWAEAATYVMPTALLAGGGWLDEIRHRVNALRADHMDAWLAAIDALLSDPALRRRVGLQAARDVKARGGPLSAMRALDAALTWARTSRRHDAAVA